ncbi:MAG TPA: hypothetical protein DDY78_09980 [Planctomycetales bacterium]|jgi:hypothetical protein|nr:hypothetical protein [Planctomycetales bacterium]
MADTSIVFGILLAILGLYGFFTTGMVHFTALIPAGVGLVLAVLGAVGRKEALRKYAMHAAAAVGMLGFLGSAFMIVRKIPQLVTEGRLTHADGTSATDSFMANCAMAALCGVFVALCVKSFIDVRRRRKAGEGSPMSDARL